MWYVLFWSVFVRDIALFEPDKNHIHHKLLAIGLSPRKAMLSLLFMSCSFSAANILLVPDVNNTVLLVADIVIWIG